MTSPLPKLLILSLPFLLFGGLLWNYLVPFGVKTLTYEMGDSSPFVQRLLPDERVVMGEFEDGDTYAEIRDEPVYFSVFPPPGNFTAVTAEVLFKTEDAALLEIGLLKDIQRQAFDFRPLANTFLETLDWPSVKHEDGVTLFSRHGDFLGEIDRSALVTYKATPSDHYRIDNYKPLGRSRINTVDLKGPQEFLTYIKDERFSLALSYYDVNSVLGSDEGVIRVFNEDGELMLEAPFADDGNVSADGVEAREKTIELADGGPPFAPQELRSGSPVASAEPSEGGWIEGVYRVAVSSTSDIVWHSVSTKQRYFVSKNALNTVASAGTYFTNAKHLAFEAPRAEGIQTAALGDDAIEVVAVQEKVTVDIAEVGVLKLELPKGNIKVTGEGKYAFSEDAFFDPDPMSFTSFVATGGEGAEYILANTVPLGEEGGWRVASAAYSLAGVPLERGAYKFAFSLPTVHDDDGGASIHEIRLTFNRPATARSFLSGGKQFVKKLIF